MEHQDRRRKFKRYSVRWKAAVVFDAAYGKPILHTHTHDLSIGGTAMHSDYGDLTGSQVTLLLAPPLRQGSEAPKMLKIRAQVVSSVHSPAMSGFRHGLRFMPAKDDGLDALAAILSSAAPAAPGAAPVTPAMAAEPEAYPASPGSLLAQLRQAALAKQRELQQPDSKEQLAARVSAAVERTYRYLKALAGQLSLEKPAYAGEYSIVGVPKFDGLKWAGVRCDFHTRELSPTTKVFERLTLDFHLTAGRNLSLTREAPADEKLKQMLLETKIEFTTQQQRNDRGTVIGTTFVIPCEVKAGLQLSGNFNTGKLLLKMRNVEHFGTLEHVLAAEAVTEESLDELGRFILGKSRRIGPLLLKDA